MLSLIQAKVVTEHNWIDEQTFTDIVAISQMTPAYRNKQRDIHRVQCDRADRSPAHIVHTRIFYSNVGGNPAIIHHSTCLVQGLYPVPAQPDIRRHNGWAQTCGGGANRGGRHNPHNAGQLSGLEKLDSVRRSIRSDIMERHKSDFHNTCRRTGGASAVLDRRSE